MAFRTPSLISFTFQVGRLLRWWRQLHPSEIQEDLRNSWRFSHAGFREDLDVPSSSSTF
jgi:hypothetical protein